MFAPVSVEQRAPGNYFVVQILNGNQQNYNICEIEQITINKKLIIFEMRKNPMECMY